MRRELTRWKAADGDADGRLSQDEFVALVHPELFAHMEKTLVEETLEDMDKNHNGRIERDEFLDDVLKQEGALACIRTSLPSFCTLYVCTLFTVHVYTTLYCRLRVRYTVLQMLLMCSSYSALADGELYFVYIIFQGDGEFGQDASDGEWLQSEREHFDTQYDRNRDGSLDYNEILLLLRPEASEHQDEEVCFTWD